MALFDDFLSLQAIVDSVISSVEKQVGASPADGASAHAASMQCVHTLPAATVWACPPATAPREPCSEGLYTDCLCQKRSRVHQQCGSADAQFKQQPVLLAGLPVLLGPYLIGSMAVGCSSGSKPGLYLGCRL